MSCRFAGSEARCSPQSRFSGMLSARKAQSMATANNHSPFHTCVGFLGNPNSADPFKFWRVVPWTDENLLRLKDLGFNTIQVNVAWGPRPNDEPLNLEDVVELPADLAAEYPQ